MMTNLHDQFTKYTSSQRMEHSEIQKRAIGLGKALVNELGLEPGVDTLSRWMAHYIAEQIATVENAPADEKQDAEQRCFETILKLWSRRAEYPRGRRPFECFESIFRALETWDPERPPYLFWRQSKDEGNPSRELSENEVKVQYWLDIIQKVNDGSALIIRFCLAEAYIIAKEAGIDDKLWLTDESEEDEDLQVLAILERYTGDIKDPDRPDSKVQKQRNRIETLIRALDSLRDVAHSTLREIAE